MMVHTRRLRTKDVFFFFEAFLALHLHLNKKSEIFSNISRFSGLVMSRKEYFREHGNSFKSKSAGQILLYQERMIILSCLY